MFYKDYLSIRTYDTEQDMFNTEHKKLTKFVDNLPLN